MTHDELTKFMEARQEDKRPFFLDDNYLLLWNEREQEWHEWGLKDPDAYDEPGDRRQSVLDYIEICYRGYDVTLAPGPHPLNAEELLRDASSQ